MSEKSKGAAKSTHATPDVPVVPKMIYAQASPRSAGGVSLFEAQDQVMAETVTNFFSEEDLVTRAATRLQEAGFEILQVSPLTINIAGSPETYQRAFNGNIQAVELPVIKAFGEETTATFLDSPQTDLLGLISTANTPFADILEGIALEQPRYFMAPSALPPTVPYFHLTVPSGVSHGDNADIPHTNGITGKNVKVAMCDTGHYKHPYFVSKGYNIAPVTLGPAAANPLDDEVGHGTGESANIFAIAPSIHFFPVKMNFVNSIGAFNAAVGLKPDIITCSWGSSNQFGPLSAADQALAAAISAAVASGITVIFSAGNGHWGFPGQHPDVISAGGVFMAQNGSLTASNYASGFMSNIYPGRRVPDLCGLVGMLPKAIYIMLPLQPGDQIDVANAGGTFPNGDQTASDDGWAAFSGTSAAAPQLAGAAALLKQVCPSLTPADIKDILRKSARDVTTGNGNANTGGNAATVGPDTATGDGLLDAAKAVLLAKVRCKPITIQPIAVKPIGVRPITVQPIGIRPISVLPIRPIQPIQPIRPISPIINPGPINPAALSETESETNAPPPELPSDLSDREQEQLEAMIVNDEISADDIGI